MRKRKSAARKTPEKRSRVARGTSRVGVPTLNDCESPISWLYRRRGKDGKSLITEAQFQAGERLREDFTFAHLSPRVTSDWGGVGGSSGARSAPGTGVEVRDAVIAARDRVHHALTAVGPELSGILLDVCCHLKGLETAEKRAGWPQRSGKVVLQLALSRLARHYGFEEVVAERASGAVRVRHWGGEGYRPDLEMGD